MKLQLWDTGHPFLHQSGLNSKKAHGDTQICLGETEAQERL